MARALKEMQMRYRYLALPMHGLYSIVQDCEVAIEEGNEEKAKDILERLEHEVEQEATTLTAAFNLFKPPVQEDLSEKEVRIMLEYLGFPKEEEDVEKLLDA